jgi:hypothetical protein
MRKATRNQNGRHFTPNIMATKKVAKANKPGLYANIDAKKKRIEKGSGETMRKKGTEGAPEDDAFSKAAKTAAKK